MPRAEHCEGGRGKGGERVPSALSAVPPRSSLVALAWARRRRAQSLLRWWLALRLPPRAELRAADEERTRVQRGSADLIYPHMEESENPSVDAPAPEFFNFKKMLERKGCGAWRNEAHRGIGQDRARA
eukprot:scaffold20489_cov107-Isochrysis_galbana.AAC.2